MRVVTFNGLPVKRQHRTRDGQIKVVFYNNQAPVVVSPADWRERSRSEFHSADVKRSDVVRK